MKRSIVFLLHLSFWTCYLLLILIMLAIYSKSGANISNQGSRILNAFNTIFLFALVPSFISFYSFYYILFSRYLQLKKVLLSIIYGLLISCIAALIGYIVLRYFIESGRLIDMDEGGKNGRSTALSVITIMTFISSISGIVALVIKGFITWFDEIKLKEELQQKTHEMELALVKSQLDPHFLFNTINNIDVLILKDAVRASNYLNNLSDIMRFMLYETKADKILLAKEIEYISKYVELQKIRTANPSYATFSVEGVVGGRTIAPMVFIPFIENAFKHTNNKKIENAITIDIQINKEAVIFACSNKFNQSIKAQKKIGGLGNDLIQKRLNLLYPNCYTLEVVKEEGLYSVALIIRNGETNLHNN